MSEIYYSGGYFLVEPTLVNKPYLNEQIYTISNCLANLYPNDALLPGSKQESEKKAIQNRIALQDEDFNKMLLEISNQLGSGLIGWPNVFMNLLSAKQFKAKFLKHLQDVKIVGISIEKKIANNLLQEELQNSKPNQKYSGIVQILSNKIPLDKKGEFLGYDILGYEIMLFHSYVCNGLEKDIVEDLHIELNEKGLINSYVDAKKVIDYINHLDNVAEPAFWAPWRVDEYH
ncbi:MAG: hypothetical protein WCP97_01575 [bacterium]